MPSSLPEPVFVSIVCWFAFEILLVFNDLIHRRGRLRQDRGTKFVASAALVGGVLLAAAMRTLVPAAALPGGPLWTVLGVVVLWCGLILRAVAVLTLGRSFRTTVEIDEDQAVVTRGPYRWIRHPSYTGLLLITTGFGLACGNGLSVIAAVVVPALGLLPRIAVEEAAMVRVLGDPYRTYMAHTDRLLPRVW